MTKLFGPDRVRVGYQDQEWAVWVSAMDEIHDKDSLAEALEAANELNASFAMAVLDSSSELDPRPYAVVIRHGYVWTADTEHKMRLDCGHPACGPCSFDRAVPAST